MENNQSKFVFNTKLIFWIVMTVIGLAGLITGSILIGISGNTLFWLPTALGIGLFAISVTMLVYLLVLEHKRKVVRSRGI